MRKKKISASVVGLALIFTLIFTWGLCTAADYGVYFDEPSEQEILRQNLKEYAVPSRGRAGGGLLRPAGRSAYFRKCGKRPWPERLLPAGPGAAACRNRPPPCFIGWWHAYSWGLFTLGLLGLYLLLREMGLGFRPSSGRGSHDAAVAPPVCGGALQQQGHGPADAGAVVLLSGPAAVEKPNAPAGAALLAGGRAGGQYQDRRAGDLGDAVRGGAGLCDGPEAVEPLCGAGRADGDGLLRRGSSCC